MAELAQEAATALALECPSLEAYAIDTAIDDASGEPLVIEINPIDGAGLYATNADMLMRAILRHALGADFAATSIAS
jgi:hypothetical protein